MFEKYIWRHLKMIIQKSKSLFRICNSQIRNLRGSNDVKPGDSADPVLWTSGKSMIIEAGRATDPLDAVERRLKHAISVKLADGCLVKLIKKNELIPVARTILFPVGAKPLRVHVGNGPSPRFVGELPVHVPDGYDFRPTTSIVMAVTARVDAAGNGSVSHGCRAVKHVKADVDGDAGTTAAAVRPEANGGPTTAGGGVAAPRRDAVVSYIMHSISVELDDGSVLKLIGKNERVPVVQSAELPAGLRPIKVHVGVGTSQLHNEFSGELPLRAPDGCDGGPSADVLQTVVVTASADVDGKFAVDYVCRTVERTEKTAVDGDATTVGEQDDGFASQHSADSGKNDSDDAHTSAAAVKQEADPLATRHSPVTRSVEPPVADPSRPPGVYSGNGVDLRENTLVAELPLYAPAGHDGVSAEPEEEPSTGDDDVND